MTTEQRADRKRERAEWAVKQAALFAEAATVVATGKCPTCGAPLRRNLSLTGWWTCEQNGAVGFRKDSSKPACGYYTFTEF